MQYICLLILRRDIDIFFIDNKKQSYALISVYTLDNYNLLIII